MLLADRFTYVHEPKTGGTFVTHVLSQVHGGLRDLLPPSRFDRAARLAGCSSLAFAVARRGAAGGENRYGPIYRWNDHGECCEIPRSRRDRPILATVRNPLQTYVSLFLFGWWKRTDSRASFERRIPDFEHRFADYPDLAFPQYLELQQYDALVAENRILHDRRGHGLLSESFLRYYFKIMCPRPLRPRSIRSTLAALSAGQPHPSLMFGVDFIPTANLNRELSDYLVERGYASDDVSFIENFGHVVPTGGEKVEIVSGAASDDWRSYYDDELEALVRERERLMFALFPSL